jgi:hypothetical protein
MRRLLALSVVAVATLTGCGGGEESGDAVDSSPTVTPVATSAPSVPASTNTIASTTVVQAADVTAATTAPPTGDASAATVTPTEPPAATPAPSADPTPAPPTEVPADGGSSLTEADVAGLEAQLDEIDQILSDLEADLAAD